MTSVTQVKSNGFLSYIADGAEHIATSPSVQKDLMASVGWALEAVGRDDLAGGVKIVEKGIALLKGGKVLKMWTELDKSASGITLAVAKTLDFIEKPISLGVKCGFFTLGKMAIPVKGAFMGIDIGLTVYDIYCDSVDIAEHSSKEQRLLDKRQKWERELANWNTSEDKKEPVREFIQAKLHKWDTKYDKWKNLALPSKITSLVLNICLLAIAAMSTAAFIASMVVTGGATAFALPLMIGGGLVTVAGISLLGLSIANLAPKSVKMAKYKVEEQDMLDIKPKANKENPVEDVERFFSSVAA